MSNAFRVSSSKQPSNGFNAVYHTYGDRFNYCDNFNRCLHSFYYPFRRMTWEKNFDSVIVSALFINCFHLWKFAGGGNHDDIRLKDFMSLLALELLQGTP